MLVPYLGAKGGFGGLQGQLMVRGGYFTNKEGLSVVELGAHSERSHSALPGAGIVCICIHLHEQKGFRSGSATGRGTGPPQAPGPHHTQEY